MISKDTSETKALLSVEVLQDALRKFWSSRYPISYRVQSDRPHLKKRIEWMIRSGKRWITGKSVGVMTAHPNPIRMSGDETEKTTTLKWKARRIKEVEVRLNTPDGPLFNRSAGSGSATTGPWVHDGQLFYLQDVSGGLPLAEENTLATVKLAVLRANDDRKQSRKMGVLASLMDRPWLRRALQAERYTPPVGHVRFGDLRRLKPIGPSPDGMHRGWGFDRGGAIDRYYIENFLASYTDDVRGRVLEVGDNTYTCRFGCDRVVQSDILNRLEDESPATTIVADMANAPQIPSEAFDCVIFTQTLQLIYDPAAAIRTLYRILKPGGVVLATMPGISQTYDREWGNSWCWSFTSRSARRLFGEIFSEANVSVEAYGNVLVAIAFLEGLGVEELCREELDYRDRGYEFLITVRAVKSKAES